MKQSDNMYLIIHEYDSKALIKDIFEEVEVINTINIGTVTLQI